MCPPYIIFETKHHAVILLVTDHKIVLLMVCMVLLREELFLHNQTILQDKKEEACFILLSFVFCSKQASFKHYFIQRSYDLKLTKRLLLIVFVGCVLF